MPTFAQNRFGHLPSLPGLAARLGAALATSLALAACATTSLPAAPVYQQSNSSTEAEYQPYLVPGPNALTGQAVQVLADGRRLPVVGRTVTLDPATSTGNDWWRVAGRVYGERLSLPPTESFARARRTAVTDGEGRFAFRQLPAGSYWIRTDYGGLGADSPRGLLGGRVAVPAAGAVVLDRPAE